MDFIKRITNWYFSKKMLPYWVILLADAAIVFGSAVFTYWIFNHTEITYENHVSVFLTAALSAGSARVASGPITGCFATPVSWISSGWSMPMPSLWFWPWECRSCSGG